MGNKIPSIAILELEKQLESIKTVQVEYNL